MIMITYLLQYINRHICIIFQENQSSRPLYKASNFKKMQQEQVFDGCLHYMQFVIIMHVFISNQSSVNYGNIYKWGCLIYWRGGGR